VLKCFDLFGSKKDEEIPSVDKSLQRVAEKRQVMQS